MLAVLVTASIATAACGNGKTEPESKLPPGVVPEAECPTTGTRDNPRVILGTPQAGDTRSTYTRWVEGGKLVRCDVLMKEDGHEGHGHEGHKH